MDLYTLFLLVAVIVFVIAAWISKSLTAVGLAFFAGAFLTKTLEL
jgi:hypothetical protein